MCLPRLWLVQALGKWLGVRWRNSWDQSVQGGAESGCGAWMGQEILRHADEQVPPSGGGNKEDIAQEVVPWESYPQEVVPWESHP